LSSDVDPTADSSGEKQQDAKCRIVNSKRLQTEMHYNVHHGCIRIIVVLYITIRLGCQDLPQIRMYVKYSHEAPFLDF
jgi:hypothetical protein